MPQSFPIFIGEVDLTDAAEKIRPKNSVLADLLDAVDDVDKDSLHTVVEYPDGETECTEDCTPCSAKYAAQVVAHQYLRAMAVAA